MKMNKKFKALLVLCLLSLEQPTYAQSYKSIRKKIDSLFSAYTNQTPGVAVAVVKDDQVVFKKGYGMANLTHHIPITPQTVFNIASVSKQFTAFAIYLLADEKKLSFDDPISLYIPELPHYNTPIKIKHLLAHTSGLPDHGALASIAGYHYLADLSTTEQNLKLLANQKQLNFIPGSAFGYCNTNYTLLAEIVRRVSGKSFAAYAEEKIFKPLGMTNSLVVDNPETIVKNKAESYEWLNDRYYQKSLMDANAGPSNVYTTVEDLAKWVLNFEHPIVGHPELLKAFNEPSYLDHGQKVILRIIDGDTIFHAKGQNVSKEHGLYLGHGGHTAGFRTFMGRYPGHRLAIIQLSNDEDNEKLGGRWDIADFYLKKQDLQQQALVQANPAPTPITPPQPRYAIDLNEFTGNFYNDVLEAKYQFEVKDQILVMKHHRLHDISLKRVGENKFSGSGPYTFGFEITFISNEKDEIIGLDMSNYGVKNIRFNKVR